MTPIQCIRKLRRFVWRTQLQFAATRGPQLGELEEALIFHLYSGVAQSLGLKAGRIGDVLSISGNSRTLRLNGASNTDLDGIASAALSGDKATVRTLLEQQGLPIPEGRSFSIEEPDRALEFALSLGRPCVVKPAAGTSQGIGVTIGLTDRRRIRRAFDFASVYSPRVLIEEMVPGESYRFLVYKGRCVSVVQREAAQVVGSGAHTVGRLVELENERRFKGGAWRKGDPVSMPIKFSKEARALLREAGMDWSSAPDQGRIIRLARLANIRSGGTYLEVTRRANRQAVSAAEAAARIVGLNLAGVDILSSDIESPLFRLTEVNIGPYIPMHYCIRNPDQGLDPIRTFLADFFGVPDEAAIGLKAARG